ncbi:MAG: response regulator [Pseudomonadota bacterium]
MRLDSPLKLRKLFSTLVVAVLVVLAAVAAFVANSLHQSQLRYFANADETSRNLAISLENSLKSHFLEVDLAMRRAEVEFRAMHAQGRFTDAAFSAYLRSLRERIPQARSVRGTNRDGIVIYGDEIDLAKPQDLKIREFYQRALTERELIFGVPIISRITGEMVFPLIYAMTEADGTFGGTAYVNMNNSRIIEMIASLKLGEHGVISLLDTKGRVLHRFPESKAVTVGVPYKLSPQTAAILSEGVQRATYAATSVLDGEARRFSIERIGHYPVYVLVGLAEHDVLAPWRDEVRGAVVFLLLLLALAAALLTGVRYSFVRQYQAFQQLVAKEEALQASLGALRVSEQRFRSFTEGLPQMVWTVTPTLRPDFLSHHWRDYTGMSPDAMLEPDTWLKVVHPDDLDAFNAAWRAALADGRQFRCDCRLRRHDGVWRTFDNHALAQRDVGGEIVCWVGSSTDMSETRAAHLALLAAKDDALKAGRAKSDFVANMSHEIRSPMNAVLGMLQLLQKTPLSARQLDYAAKAEVAAKALLGILNDILDFSKVEEGKLTLDPHRFNFDDLLRELAVILSANVGDKEIEVLFNIDPALPRWLLGDAMRLQQVLLNLAGNAIKFTERGEVVLSVRQGEVTADGIGLAFAIRDTGIGISDEHLGHIFDGFTQAEASTARRYGGTGLGLAISERLVRLMGGKLRVDSAPGAGSTFSFELVLRQAEQAPQADAARHVRLQNLDCLVVDDNQTGREVLAAMLGAFGWRVELTTGGAEAIAAVTRRSAGRCHDVVFMDWRMPGLDGWDTSRLIRQLMPAEVAPLIVMVTAHDRELIAERHGDIAAMLDGMLVKPVTASMLFDLVADIRLGRRVGLPALPTSQRRLAGLNLLVVEDNPTNQQVACELLREDGAGVVLADCGQAGIEAALRNAPPIDLVLMDIQMPDMDGYTAARAIRAQLGGATPPIVAMTANAMPADRQAALDAGMVDHIGKPFDLGQLVGVILHHVRAGPAPCIERAVALARFGGNAGIYATALHGFGPEQQAMSASLESARTAGDTAAAMALLHTLKGLAGTIGATRLAALAFGAEQALKAGAAGWAEIDAVQAEAGRVSAEAARG